MTHTRRAFVFSLTAFAVMTGAPFGDPSGVRAAQAAQQPQRDNLSAPTGTAVIAGVVVADDGSARPLARAQVRLSGGDIRVQPLTMTDSSGRFVFVGLPAGRYTLSASKPGYVPTYYGAKRQSLAALALPIALTEGQKLPALELKMLHGAAITGTLRDENGRPVPSTSIQIVGARMSNGHLTTEYVAYGGVNQTDDRGTYRVYGLPPGSYLISATLSAANGTSVRLTTDDEVKWAERRAQAAATGMAMPSDAALPPPPQGQAVAYTPVYYPGVVDPQTATLVTLGPAEERGGIDFGLRLVPTAKVQGTVLGLDGHPAQGVQLQLIGGGNGLNDSMSSIMMLEFMMNSARTAATGKFSFAGIKPGQYTVSARASSKTPPAGAPAGRGAGPAPAVQDLWAEMPIAVDGHDLADVSLTLQPGMTISGKVVFDGQTPPPDVTRVRVSLQLPPTSGPRLGIPQATVNADGTFEMAGVTPGQYRLDAYSPGIALVNSNTPAWSLRAATLNGRNLSDVPFELRPNENLSGVTIAFTDNTTEISGTLFDTAGRPAPDYYVFAYPADRARWVAGSRGTGRPVRPDSSGKYTISNLPPGEYYICALPDVDQNSMND